MNLGRQPSMMAVQKLEDSIKDQDSLQRAANLGDMNEDFLKKPT